MDCKTSKESIPNGVGSTFFMCRQQALRYLGIREHNKSELRTKLLGKGYDANLVDSVLDDLSNDNSLSERRYVECFVRSSNRRHPEGRSLVLARLVSKGADRQVCNEVLDELYGNGEYVSSLVHQASLRIVSKKKSKRSSATSCTASSNVASLEMRQALLKLGFSPSQIRTCLEDESSLGV